MHEQAGQVFNKAEHRRTLRFSWKPLIVPRDRSQAHEYQYGHGLYQAFLT